MAVVISRDRRGLAVLVDALMFLAALTLVSALLVFPQQTPAQDEGNVPLSLFHQVMMGSDVSDEGSALSQVSLSCFLVMVVQDGRMDDAEKTMLERACHGTLEELDDRGAAWWTLVLNGQEHTFGTVPPLSGNVLADTWNLGPGLSCTLHLQP